MLLVLRLKVGGRGQMPLLFQVFVLPMVYHQFVLALSTATCCSCQVWSLLSCVTTFIQLHPLLHRLKTAHDGFVASASGSHFGAIPLWFSSIWMLENLEGRRTTDPYCCGVAAGLCSNFIDFHHHTSSGAFTWLSCFVNSLFVAIFIAIFRVVVWNAQQTPDSLLPKKKFCNVRGEIKMSVLLVSWSKLHNSIDGD